VNIQDGSTGNRLYNNILLHPSPSRGAIDICAGCTSGMLSNANAVVGRFSIDGAMIDLATWRTRTGADAASFVASEAELFNDPAHGDLALRAGSPAIDRGVTDGAPLDDVLGTARPQGTAIDIGAYERCDGACAGSGSGSGSGSDGGDGSGGSGDPGTGDPGSSGAGGGGGGCGAGSLNLGWLAIIATVVLSRGLYWRRGGSTTRP
jgi:hypothetical protein